MTLGCNILLLLWIWRTSFPPRRDSLRQWKANSKYLFSVEEQVEDNTGHPENWLHVPHYTHTRISRYYFIGLFMASVRIKATYKVIWGSGDRVLCFIRWGSPWELWGVSTVASGGTLIWFCDPMDCNPPVSSAHGILQAGILECVFVTSSRGPSQPRGWTWVSCISGRFFFTIWATRKAHLQVKQKFKKETARVRSSIETSYFCVQEKPRWRLWFCEQQTAVSMSALNWKPFVYGGLASITAECGK